MQYKWTSLEHKEGGMDQLIAHIHHKSFIAPIIKFAGSLISVGCVMQNGVTGKVYITS